MKKFLVSLAFFSLAEAQIPEIEVVNSLKKEIVEDNPKSPEESQKILTKYFNDGCRIKVNDEKIILKQERFSQYASIAAAFFPKIKKNFELKISKDISKSDDGKVELNASLDISKNQKTKIDFVLENKKFSEIICKDVPLSKGQRFMLRGVFNLLK